MQINSQAIECAERNAVETTLASDRSAGAAMRISQDAQEHSDWLTGAAKQLIPSSPVACREGCAFCCRLRVVTTIPEVLQIAAAIQLWPSPQQSAVRARIEAHVAAMAGVDGIARRITLTTCPLLVDSRCSVYLIRPLSCRGWNSLDAEACEANDRDPSRMLQIEINMPQHQISAHVQQGMADGLKRAGLEHNRVEFMDALKLALVVPDAEARWLAGESVFQSAVAHLQAGSQ